MGKKQLIILSIVAVALGAAYFALDSSESKREAPKEVHLFDDVKGDAIAQVVLEQGKEKLELVAKDGAWTIPSRGNFPADTTKIRALLLKIFDLSVSQKIPLSAGAEKEAQLAKLGVVDASIEKGQSKVSFLEAGGKPVASLRVGAAIQGKKSSVFSGRGQYIRRDLQDAVYAASLPIEISAKVSSWLLGDVVTVLQSGIVDIEQAQLSEGEQSPPQKQFMLERASLNDFLTGKAKDFEFRGTVAEGRHVDDTGVSQLAGALENLRALDVWPADSPDIKDLKFDTKSVFRTTSGLVYEVQTASKGELIYAKISVRFDQGLVDTIKAAFEVILRDFQARATPTPSATATPTPAALSSETPGATATPSPTPAPQATPEPPKASSAEEAKKQNDRYARWVYQIPVYQGAALRKTLDTIVVAPQKESAPPAGMLPQQ